MAEKKPATGRRARSMMAEMSDPLTPAPITVHSPIAGSPTLNTDLPPDARKIDKARRQRRAILNAEARLRRDMFDDRRFRLGHLGDEYFQWPDGILKERRADKRVAIQVNRTAGFVDMARNDGDAANLRVKVTPVDDAGDQDIANVIAGLIRNVETRGMAGEDTYNCAGDAQCEMGRGYVFVRTEWDPSDPWRQRPVLSRVLNPFRVKVDATHNEKDASDAECSFYDTDIDEDTWKDRYGTTAAGAEREVPSSADFTWESTGDGSEANDWFPSGKKIRMMHWFCAEYEPDTLYQLADGRSMHTKELEAEVRRLAAVAQANAHPVDTSEEGIKAAIATFKKPVDQGGHIKQSRPDPRRVIKWRLIDAKYVHFETEWPTPWQPLIPMVGNESDLDGERDVRGVVRDVKDSQRIYNVEVSSEVELVNDLPKAPYIGYKGVFGKPNTPMNNSWKNATTKRYAYLEAEVVDIDGKAAPLPQRNYGEPAIAGVNATIQQASEDMKSVARLHDASLGEGPTDRSGTAIRARQGQDQKANSHYTVNRRRAIASVGRQLIVLFRKLYDVATVVRITGLDNQQKKVVVYSGADNDPRKDPNYQLPKGVKEIFDIGTGEYDVEVSAGPDPGAHREQDLDITGKLLETLPPEYAPAMADVVAGLINSPVGRTLEARFRKMLPPPLQDHTEDDEGPLPPKAQQAMAENQQLKQKLQEAAQIIHTEQTKIEGQIRIENLKFLHARTLQMMKDGAMIASAKISMVGKGLMQDASAIDEAVALGQARAHELGMAAADAHHAATQADLDHQRGMAVADQAHGHALEQGEAAAAVAPEPEPEPVEGE